MLPTPDFIAEEDRKGYYFSIGEKFIMQYEYVTQGTCSRKIYIEIEENKIKNVSFVGGCSGNLQGISKLVEGMMVEDVIARLKGIRCGFKPTSCPDQLASALEKISAEKA